MARLRIVRDFKRFSYTFEFGAADLSEVSAIDPKLGIKGEVAKLIIKLPNWTNAVTAVVSMNNSDGDEIFADDPRARDDDYAVTLDRNECIILGQTDEEWKITLSGVPGGTGGTATVVVYVER